MFLELFAYSQMFCFIIQNYVVAAQQKQKQEEEADPDVDRLHVSRQSDYMLNKFSTSQTG